MKVDLFPINGDDIIEKLYIACRTCYNAGTPNDMMESVFNSETRPTEEKMVSLLNHILSSGHHSVLEHVQLTFAISGVSRALTHQLVRHRLCSYSQQSQRYCGLKTGVFDFVVPPSIEKNKEATEAFYHCMGYLAGTYAKLTELGIPSEDARMVLPNACHTSIVMSVNLRELIHICNERLCSCAQWEIRAMVKEMAKLVSEQAPFLKRYLVPKCETLGYCNESPQRSCGRKKSLEAQLQEAYEDGCMITEAGEDL